MWCGVENYAIMLLSNGLLNLADQENDFFILCGFLGAMPIHHFGFLKDLLIKTLKGCSNNRKKCVFSFMTWRSYFIVL